LEEEMISLKPTPMATVTPGVPALLQDGYYVKFSDYWPAALQQITYPDNTSPTGTRGKFFQIAVTNAVPYQLSYKIPSNDYRDVDFSNVNSAFNENLYPQSNKTLYETVVGFKKANFLAQLFIPAGEYVKRLEQASMVPNVTSPTLRYLGSLRYKDSPYQDPQFYFYSVFNMEPFIMRLFVDDGVDYDKIVLGLTVNKCYLNEIPPQNVTTDMMNKSFKLNYYSQLRWNN
jgi:hypothetical protein